MDPKFKRRFFEPLVLLKTLSQTQGDRIAEESEQLTEKSSRREFARQLCRACDYKKGGETVTSIALEKTPQGPVYWISLRETTAEKVVGFLREILDTLGGSIAVSPNLQEHLLSRLISFATHRLHDYRQLLKKELELARKALEAKPQAENNHRDIQSWIDELFHAIANHHDLDLCQLLYNQFVDRKHHQALTILKTLQSNIGEHEGRWVQHYMGRLASTVHASHVLSEVSRNHRYLFDDYEVKVVFCGQVQPGPALNAGLKLEAMAKRMLPHGSKDLPGLIGDLNQLDHKFNLAAKMRGLYQDRNFKLRVHTETALLEAVYAADIDFYNDDRYIACSKGACFCCYFYICHHPGRFVRPACHNKIWLNWAPPNLPDGPDAPNALSPKDHRDLLIKINNDIRQHAIEEVRSKTGSKRWHPDSTTGMGFAKSTVQVSVFEESRERSSSVESIRAAPESESPVPEPEPQTPVLLSQESDCEDGGVLLDLISAQVSSLRF